jgi:hypothetical protein
LEFGAAGVGLQGAMAAGVYATLFRHGPIYDRQFRFRHTLVAGIKKARMAGFLGMTWRYNLK